MIKNVINNKDKKYWAILNSCIQLEISHGHLKWKISDLHRKSKVSRTLIYYYFGKNRKNILLEACHYFGSILSGLDPELMILYEKGQLAEAIYRNKQMLLKIPALIPFYFLFRDREGEIGDIIRDYESKGVKKRKHFFSHLTDQETKALFALQMGLSFSNLMVTKKDIEVGFSMLKISK